MREGKEKVGERKGEGWRGERGRKGEKERPKGNGI